MTQRCYCIAACLMILHFSLIAKAGEAPKADAPARWEYKVLQLEDLKDDLQAYLNQLGGDAWELTSTVTKDQKTLLIFKRRQQASSTRSHHVGEIIIVGNEKTPFSVIMEAVSLFSGQVLDPKDLKAAEKRLASLGLFAAPPTVAILDPDRADDIKSILITVQEK